MNKTSGRILIGIALVFSVAFLAIASHRNLTDLENVLFQVISLGIGLIGAYVLGEASAKENLITQQAPQPAQSGRRVVHRYHPGYGPQCHSVPERALCA